MPDKNQPQAVASQDHNGYVHLEIDAPAGSVVTQPIASQSDNPPPPVPPPMFPPAFDPATMQQTQPQPSNPSSSSDSSEQPPEAQTITEKMQQAKSKEQSAKQQTETALEEVKKVEEQAKSTQEELKQRVQSAKQKVSQAQTEIEQAQKQQQEGKNKLKELQQNSSTSIAGYKPLDLVQALGKPPQPDYSQEMSSPSLDKETQKEIQNEIKSTEQQVKETQKQVSEANKQIEKADKQAKQSLQQHVSILDKVTSLIQKLTGDEEDSQSSEQPPHKAFLIMGIGLLALALITIPFASPFIWMLIAIAAFVQIGMGTMLKRKSN